MRKLHKHVHKLNNLRPLVTWIVVKRHTLLHRASEWLLFYAKISKLSATSCRKQVAFEEVIMMSALY